MAKYFKLGSYSISILHYSLYYWDKREVVFLRPIKVFKNHLAYYYGYRNDEKRMYKIWWQRIDQDPNYLVKHGQWHRKNFTKLENYLNKVLKKVPEANKRKMLKTFSQYWQLLFFAEPIGDINHTIDEIYLKRISEDFKFLLKSQGSESKFTEYLVALTTPWRVLSTQKERLDFLLMVRDIKSGKIKDTITALKKHLNKYEWIPVWYDNKPWNLDDLKIRLKQELRTKDLDLKIQQIKNLPEKIKLESLRLQKKLKIKGRLLQDLYALRHFTFIRTEIDLDTSYIVYKAKPIYERIVGLLGLTFYQLKFLIPKEIKSGLLGKLTSKQLKIRIKERQKLAVQIFNGSKQEILTGEKAKDYIKEIERETEITRHKRSRKQGQGKLIGIGASPGKAEGRARVISSISQLKTMKEGEILIVPSTSVDFVGAMNKSAAVVTEVGGITCHAAIISRELGKPCVVNTMIATEVFKTGDMVEVDANHGVVKIIK